MVALPAILGLWSLRQEAEVSDHMNLKTKPPEVHSKTFSSGGGRVGLMKRMPTGWKLLPVVFGNHWLQYILSDF